MQTWSGVKQAIEERAAEVGVQVRLHACQVDGDAAAGIGEHDPVVTASVFKVPVAVALADRVHRGELDLAQEFTVLPSTGPPSPYGLATFRNPARLALDELALLMIGISDNVATDLVLATVGKPAVAELLSRLGLKATAVPQDCKEILDGVRQDLALDYDDDERSLEDLPLDRIRALRALQPEQTCRTTPEEMTRLLGMVWRDEAAAAPACANVRRWLGLQVWPHRLSSGFPGASVKISAKTGTLPTVRNEAGVVEYAGGGRYAVAVFTTAADAASRVPARDHFIGEAATMAVDYLREASGAG
ncbi:MAG TPA: serine hydrolase [Streptosporangiaceae bacterium]